MQHARAVRGVVFLDVRNQLGFQEGEEVGRTAGFGLAVDDVRQEVVVAGIDAMFVDEVRQRDDDHRGHASDLAHEFDRADDDLRIPLAVEHVDRFVALGRILLRLLRQIDLDGALLAENGRIDGIRLRRKPLRRRGGGGEGQRTENEEAENRLTSQHRISPPRSIPILGYG